MSTETRDALLFGQMQEGLKYSLMESPSVSGATSYEVLCVAARSEECRQAALKKCKQYQATPASLVRVPSKQYPASSGKRPEEGSKMNQPGSGTYTQNRSSWKCWKCGKLGHISKDCRQAKTESSGRVQPKSSTKMVQSETATAEDNPMQYLFSDSDDGEVRQVRVEDKGSTHQQARVIVGGVPMYGVVDTGSDVTIMSGSLFKQVAAAARLRKKDFRPCNYDR